ncbi:hypothetical protein [Lapidilactobacillus dextrinicus]|uniref:hypothetical protein n=1 Tax=Lapidilactobacillus dextrinicus TaxID=51664 RepID=UPI003F21F0F2
MALTEAQKRAKAKYQKKNREKQARYTLKSKAKSFIKNEANDKELKELIELIKERKLVLKKEEE